MGISDHANGTPVSEETNQKKLSCLHFIQILNLVVLAPCRYRPEVLPL
jgi:hypothetical protein